MTETEKITINMGPVDLGRLDVLVEQGVYTNRTDAIRTAIRNLLDHHEPVIREVTVRRSFVLGALILNRVDLLNQLKQGKRLAINIIGLLSLSSDIDAQLALDAIESICVRGVFRAPAEVKEALAERIG